MSFEVDSVASRKTKFSFVFKAPNGYVSIKVSTNYKTGVYQFQNGDEYWHFDDKFGTFSLDVDQKKSFQTFDFVGSQSIYI